MAAQTHAVRLTRRIPLPGAAYEIRFARPAGFDFTAGQKIRFIEGGLERDYTLINAPAATELAICVRRVAGGRFSTRLAEAGDGEQFRIEGPLGYFGFHPSPRQAVCVATGTGIAPFVAFARAGVRGFDLLHGVRRPEELYYRDLLASSARSYIPCLSARQDVEAAEGFSGRVTDYLTRRLAPGVHDFYLCGRADMIADCLRIIDTQFDRSYVYTEVFY